MNVNSVGRLLLSIGVTALVVFGISRPTFNVTPQEEIEQLSLLEATALQSHYSSETTEAVRPTGNEVQDNIDKDLQKENIDIVSVEKKI